MYINFSSITEHKRITTAKYKKSTEKVGHIFLFFYMGTILNSVRWDSHSFGFETKYAFLPLCGILKKYWLSYY